jgi:hypothetical protein
MVNVANILAAGFVTPAFLLAGGALASIPIIIHILNRRRFQTVQWAAMTFLLQAMRKNRRRLRFEQWLLLAVRCMVLFLLGLALARPTGCEQTSLATLAAQRTGLHVIIIDNSYSMGFEADRPDAKTHLDQAKLLAKKLIDRLSSGGEAVALITAGRPATAIIARPSYDLDGAKTAIDRIEQSFGGTDLVGALQKALQLGRDASSQPNRSLHLFTDSTRSAWEPSQSEALAALGKDLAGIFDIAHYNLAKIGQWNHAVLSIDSNTGLVRSQFDAVFQSIVRGYGANESAVLQWKKDQQTLPGTSSIPLDLNTPPQSQSQAQLNTGGLHVMSVSLASDNRLKVDDTRWRVVDVASELKVLIVEGERGIGPLDGSGAFLSLALAPPSEQGNVVIAGGRERTSSYIQPELISDLELSNKVLGDYRAVILTGVGQLSDQQADQLKAFVQQGGTLMLFMGEEVNTDAYNATLFPRGLMPGPLARRVTSAGNPKPFSYDFNPSGSLHPLLNLFKNRTRTGLETAAVDIYYQLDLPPDTRAQRVLNYLPNAEGRADPAITVHDLGAGRIVFFSTTAGPSSGGAIWTTLPVKPAYVALVHELLAGNVISGDAWMNRLVGQSIEVPPTVQLTGTPTLKDPQQGEIILEQVQTADNRNIYRTRPIPRPGVYLLSTGSKILPIAVNVPDDEADIRPVEPAAINHALGDVKLSMYNDELPTVLADSRAPANDFGWSVMLIVLSLVAMECFLAMRFGHFRRA